MPEYGYTVIKKQIIYDDPKARRKFLSGKPDDYRGFEKHRKPHQSKSNPQLGYYWGLLVLEVTKALKALGWTVTVGRHRTSFEREWNQDDTHEWLKHNGARVGDAGENVTLSEHDLEQCSKFITNVLWICEHWLKMDIEKLKAKQPKEKDNE
ncbi:hypothetical protein LCGC14_0619240 [marine sediment metagenome]|uniref:Uncharacterized protein n=1 Tax=marine sediment metagenome TaxID=412755 RepID=A0A0F9RPH2_9ZZZZ|nr:hypothetical protein [Actinomycetota bacterium]